MMWGQSPNRILAFGYHGFAVGKLESVFKFGIFVGNCADNLIGYAFESSLRLCSWLPDMEISFI